MSLSRILKRYPLETGIAAAALVSVVFSIPSMMQNMSIMGEISKQIQLDSAQQQRLQAKQEDFKAREPIAIDRYNSGCLLVQLRNKNKLVGLAEGMEVVDNTTGMPLPQGACVVDHQGGSALIGQNGMTIDYAFTGNREVVAKALQRSGIRLVPGGQDYGSSNRTFEKQQQQEWR